LRGRIALPPLGPARAAHRARGAARLKRTAQAGPKKAANPSHTRRILRRTLNHAFFAFGVLALGLAIGIAGYEHYEHLGFRDAFLNASMILGGMGPVKTDLSDGGKIFAGIYALASGLIIIGVAGLLLAPTVHHLMHHVHWDDTPGDG
jgi:hypothetical protein